MSICFTLVRSGDVDENGVATNGAGETSSSSSGDENDEKRENGKSVDKKAKTRRQKKKKKKAKTKKSNQMRRNIRNLIGEEHLTETTKEARVSFFSLLFVRKRSFALVFALGLTRRLEKNSPNLSKNGQKSC